MKRQIIDTIERYDKIIIHRHVRPDPDAYGSQIGLKELISLNYPNKKVLATGQHENTLDFLACPDSVTNDDFNDALIIVTDTANTERIDDERYKLGNYLIKIDHHPNDDAYGDLLWVDTNASSVSELICELFVEAKDYKNWKMNAAVARLLYAGIVGDTGRFMFQSTTEQTMKFAGQLISYGFDRTELFNGMYEVESNLLQLKGYIYANFEMDDNGVGHMKLTRKLLKEYNVSDSEASLLVSVLADVKGMKCWVFFIEDADTIRVRLRSKGPVINTVAKKYGGGGHPLASGASVQTWEEADLVIEDLKKL
ncbi:bifunctional oligoribonuclease/PAP phosphatase NrnA [Psychrobacillus sp. OK032]|uniref:DHH family phosphoesterase n=1 Tax=Psychrobacillus sp. OK032 TaxID=1884358 RepID=UPI0008C2E22E|nr:bifunctional oligoribonuclease/PAP phosphatase NrnA [Psychrobacillus sp. OK032]SER90784.1 phosphoesterase RecJ domain-containing protein [Psychrobacillus sp. OK032]